ncbi:MAG: threonylcarbamoyl-AMP synthase [Myxococcales bacterium]|nr:threonylcarbamoyl-AMP synthase [Myxococcales bacterium]
MLVEVNPHHPEPRKIRRAVDALESGKVIGYPTDTVYGLGCDLFNKKAIDRLHQIKMMPKDKRLAFVCPDLSEAAKYVVLDDYAYRILKKYLPGPYCFILEATREVPKIVQTNRKTVGVRIPDNEVALALTRELGRPIISTTAAREGEEPSPDPRDVDVTFPQAEMVLDGGPGGLNPTTVIDLTGKEPVVVREGAGDVSPFL